MSDDELLDESPMFLRRERDIAVKAFHASEQIVGRLERELVVLREAAAAYVAYYFDEDVDPLGYEAEKALVARLRSALSGSPEPESEPQHD